MVGADGLRNFLKLEPSRLAKTFSNFTLYLIFYFFLLLA